MPQIRVVVDRVKAETLNVAVGDVFNVLAGYVGSSYVNQFNKFGRTFQVYVQADSKFRLQPNDIEKLYVRSQDSKMVPLGALVQIEPMVGPSLIGLYNLYPAATIVGGPAQGFSSGEAMKLMEQIADRTLPRGTGYEWTAMSYQEKVVGNQIFYVFGLGLLLVYLCLAGQYESWIAPLAVILAVPLSLIGPALALNSLGLVQQSLYADRPGAADRVVGEERDPDRRGGARAAHAAGRVRSLQAAVEAARTRFRPIVMTSFAFILGVVPLVTATGAGASARVSLGLAVLSGMMASTCLAVLFVPSFFVVMQRFEEWRKAQEAARRDARWYNRVRRRGDAAC